MIKARIRAPKWLGLIAADKYIKLVHSLQGSSDKLSLPQLDMVAMMSDSLETYLYCNDTMSKEGLITTGSQGQQVVHPAYRIQQQAAATYLKIAQQLRISLEADSESTGEVAAELDDILGGE